MKTFIRSPNFSKSIRELLEGKLKDDKTKILTSLNRYERKKNIPLALKAFAIHHESQNSILVIAGGYDTRVMENVEHEKELK